MTAQSSVAERKIVLELTDLLQKNESKVLSGETNLCLTPSSLCILDNTFRRFSENSEDVPLTPGKNVSKARQEAEKRRWKENIRALYDFVLKVKALKIIHGSSTMRTPVKIARFQSITVLEVKKLPIHMDLLEICGGDRSPGLVWSYLRNLYLSFNSLKHLDTSLRFVPFVEVLDLSIEELQGLQELDIADNFLLDHKCLEPLEELTRLNVLCVSGNPMCYKPQHRILTVGHLSSLCGFGAFLLDGKRLNGEEISVLKQNKYRNYQNEITNDPEQEDHDDETEVKVIAVSQHSMKKKRGHRRVPSKERIPAISNIEDSLMEQHLSGSTAEKSQDLTDSSDKSKSRDEADTVNRREEICDGGKDQIGGLMYNVIHLTFDMCLKCQKDFKQLSEESQPNSLLKCPSCGSNMVIGSSKVMTSGKTAGTLSPMQAGNGRENKPSVGDLREQGKFLQPDTKGYDEPDSGQQVEPDKIKSESYLSTSPKESTKGNVVPNSSCSDVRISISTAYTTQESVNSVESDIAILRQNSSQSRISDSFTEATKENVSQKVSMTVSLSEKNGHVTAESDHNTQSNGVHWLEDGKGHVTPMGSPLSNSVCSSMVSSVYENTLAGGGDDKSQGGDFEVLTEESQTGSSTDSVTLRRSLGTPEQTRLRGSRNRTMAFYGSESALSQSRNNNADDSEGLKRKSENSDIERKETKSNREFSIYESDSNRNATSIYDSAVSEQDSMGVDQNNSSVYLDTNNSNIYSENDQSSNISSPVIRRNKTSQRSQVKRQAGKFYDELSEGLQDFPSDLSPIKNSARKPKDAYIENEGTDLEKSTEALSEYSSATSQSKADDSLQTTGSLNTTGSAMLPWEIEVNKTKDSGKNESLNHDEFINIDHRAQLYLELRVFKAEETAQCAIQCAIVQYMKPKDIKSLLVISTSRILIFEITGDSSSGSDWLKCYEDQPITELHYIDIGLGYQSLRLEFDTECASYTLLIADEGKCKKFLTLISDIVQTAALSDHSKLEGIIKRNPATLSNLESQVLTFDVDPDPEGDPQTLVSTCCKL
ncbi:S11IP-like protein [Mya arenaria]|uniref:S11IP-like protein n=1 Tax=Mya arenaria TaxID=6604 RepID=A0ABY7EAQ6_MYAAR|nr:S11IP-like protein [Mya arenaria]